jgi:uncharacterized membrane protein YedE/YeeE
VAPIAYTVDWLILFSDKNKVLTIGIVSTLGVVAGSAGGGAGRGRFRWEGFAGTEDTANHLVGAVLMGVGGVTAMGCTVGQGLSGLSTLALGSFIALAGIVAGAMLALRYQVWRLERRRERTPAGQATGAPPTWSAALAACAACTATRAYARLRAARIAVVGLGGVGSWTVEALARSGVAQLVLFDLDHVAESNINRQVQALEHTLGQAKVQALRERIAGIHPGCQVSGVWRTSWQPGNWPALLPTPVDVLVDACDQVQRQGRAGRLEPARRRAAGLRGRRRWQARGAARGGGRPGRHHARPAAGQPAPAPAPDGAAPRQGRMGVRCVFSRESVPAGRHLRPGRRQPQLPRLWIQRHRDGHLRHGGRRRGHRVVAPARWASLKFPLYS